MTNRKQITLEAGNIRELAEEMRAGQLTAEQFEDIVEAKLLDTANLT